MTKAIATIHANNDTMIQDSLANFASNLGTFRDKQQYSSFSAGRFNSLRSSALPGIQSLTYQKVELESMYATDWLSKKIVNVPVDDMLRAWRQFHFGEDAELIDVYEQAEKDINLKENLRDAMRWARLYGGAGIVLGLDGTGDASMPLDIERVKKGSLKFIQALDRWHLTGVDINYTDISQDNFSQPEFYRLSFSDTLIHHSRVIVFDGEKMPYDVAKLYNFWGASVLESMYAALLSAATLSSVTTSLLHEAVTETISVDNLTNILASVDGTKRLSNRFGNAKFLQSVNNIRLLDSKEEYQRDQLQFEKLPDLNTTFLENVSGAADIPGARLFSRDLSGLNANGDLEIRNYIDSLVSKRDSDVVPNLDYLDEVLLRSTFGFVPEDFSYKFAPLWEMSATEKADIELKNQQRDAGYEQIGVVTPAMIAKNLQRDEVYAIDDDYVDALELAFTAEERQDPALVETRSPFTNPFSTDGSGPSVS